jgi:hypothetical protein
MARGGEPAVEIEGGTDERQVRERLGKLLMCCAWGPSSSP